FQLLVIALDAPAQLGQIDQAIERHVRRDGGQPILGGFGIALGPFDQQPFLAPRLGPPLVTMGCPHPNPGKARCQRSRAPLAPGNHLPACRRQTEGKRLDANGMMLAVAAHELRATAAVPSLAAIPRSAAECRRYKPAPQRRSPRATGYWCHTRRPSAQRRAANRRRRPPGSAPARSPAWSETRPSPGCRP